MFKTIRMNDPTLKTPIDLLLYPGFWAVLTYRLAHFLFKLKIPVIPRLISQVTRIFTGIEIHPGAKIGTGIFIDHGIGVVIGETAKIGNNCILFHGVTLGSKGGSNLSKTFRHPQVGNNVLLGASCKLIGPITIGDGAKIGVNAVVTKDVAPGQIFVSPTAVELKPKQQQNDSSSDDIKNFMITIQTKLEAQEAEINELKQIIKQHQSIIKSSNEIIEQDINTPSQ